MIQLRQTLETTKQILTENKIDFALIGGFALGAHGIHRATKDIDFLVDGRHKDKVKNLFLNSGFTIYFESEELIQMEGLGYLDIIFAHRPLSLKMLKTATKNTSFSDLPVVNKEGLIGLKIQAYKNDSSRELQDKADIQALLATGNIDMTLVKEYADLFHAWDEVRKLAK